MKRTRNALFLALLSAFFLFVALLSLRAMAAQQPADQTDSSSTKNPSKPKETPATPGSATTPAAKPATNPASTTTAPAAKPATTQQTTPPKSVMVWVNTDSGVYHKPGTRFYGKTKQGRYMTEADAVKAGYRPAGKN